MIRATAPVSFFHFDSSATKLPFSSRREPVVFEFALQVFSRRFPFGCDPPFALQSVECRIERAMFDLQQVIGGPLYVLCDLMPVSGTKE